MRVLTTGDRYLLRLERGEEVLDALKAFAERERSPVGTLTGLGAVDTAIVGFYDFTERVYRPQKHSGRIEVLSLTGNISWKDDEPVVHIHMSAANEIQGAFGGHLMEARVAATMEVSIVPTRETITRAQDDEIGLPLLDLPAYPHT
jgi:predicted DNA-binding protein with PD1-like motif